MLPVDACRVCVLIVPLKFALEKNFLKKKVSTKQHNLFKKKILITMEQMFLVHGATGHALKVDNNRHKGCPLGCYTDTTLTFSTPLFI